MISRCVFINTDAKRKVTPGGESKFMPTKKDFKLKRQLAADKGQYSEVKKSWYNICVV